MEANVKHAPVTRRQLQKQFKKKSLFAESCKVFFGNHLAAVGLIILVIILLMAIFADVIADYNTKVIMIDPMNRLQAPSNAHWFGTDELGRDVFARVVHGARISLKMGTLAVLLGLAIGVVLGGVAGYYGGIVDSVIMRMTDVFNCLPDLLLAIAIVAAFGSTETNLILAIGIARAPKFARVVRSAVLSVANMEYVEAARSIGSRDFRIIFSHVIVNCLGPIVVQATTGMASCITAVSMMSFIGLGISAPTPEWGCMLSTARSYMRDYAYLVLAPGMGIFLTVFSLNLMGDGLRDALDPKMRK